MSTGIACHSVVPSVRHWLPFRYGLVNWALLRPTGKVHYGHGCCVVNSPVMKLRMSSSQFRCTKWQASNPMSSSTMQAVLSSLSIGTILLTQHVRFRKHQLNIMPLDRLKVGMPALTANCRTCRRPRYRSCSDVPLSRAASGSDRTQQRVGDAFGIQPNDEGSRHDRDRTDRCQPGSVTSISASSSFGGIRRCLDVIRFGSGHQPDCFRIFGIVSGACLGLAPLSNDLTFRDAASPAACQMAPQSTDCCPAVRLRRRSRSVRRRRRPSCQ